MKWLIYVELVVVYRDRWVMGAGVCIVQYAESGVRGGRVGNEDGGWTRVIYSVYAIK